MKPFDKEPYKRINHQDDRFEIRLYKTDSDYRAAGYLDNKQVTVCYSIDFSTDVEYFKQHGDSFIENLIEYVKADIDDGRFIN